MSCLQNMTGHSQEEGDLIPLLATVLMDIGMAKSRGQVSANSSI